jgi:hypothetical protein
MTLKPAGIPNRKGHDPRWKELGKYARYLADAMGLHTWYFEISYDLPTDEDDCCEVFIGKQDVDFSLRVSDRFWKLNRYLQRWRLVHELLHVVEAPFAKACYETIKIAAPQSTGELVNQQRERFIDQVSLMLAPRYNLPSVGFKKKTATKLKRKAVGHVPHDVRYVAKQHADL